MTRTLAERTRDPHWWLEQVGHLFGVGAAPVGLVLGFSAWGFPGWPVVGGLAAAAWVGGLREWDQRPVQSWGDTAVDFAVTAAGGALVGLGVRLS